MAVSGVYCYVTMNAIDIMKVYINTIQVTSCYCVHNLPCVKIEIHEYNQQDNRDREIVINTIRKKKESKKHRHTEGQTIHTMRQTNRH